jgi:pilus assembly protein FimV
VPAAPAPRRGPPPPGAPPAPALIDDPYRVRPGDTLSELAQRGPRPAGVSLDRLVLAMYRENPEAFLGGNMHRLRKGAVLQAPSQATIDAISHAEAVREIRAQSADFGGYRERLAAMPTPRPEADGRRASGRVEAAVEDRRPAAVAADRLTLSKPEPTASAAAEAEAAAERQRRADAQRLADLSRNVQDLGRLSGAAATAASAPMVAAPTAPASAGAGPGVPLTVTPPAEPAPATTAPPADPAGASATAPPPEVAPQPAASAAPLAAPPPAADGEPGLMDRLLEDNLPAIGLAGLLVALLALFGLYRFVRRRRAAVPETSFLESRLKPDSFFGASGGQHVDTREAPAGAGSSSMMNYSLSQLDAIGDVDAVAEADVYLAYGRDLQAEEILREALRTTPDRLAVRTKLLEVYAKRRDVKGFEQLAVELFAITEGEGEEWAQAQAMGRALDPDNPLYQPGGVPTPPSSRPPVDSSFSAGNPSQPPTMPMATGVGALVDDRKDEPPLSTSFDLDLDLDLGLDGSAPATLPVDTGAAAGRSAPAQPAPAASAPSPGEPLNFVEPSGFGPLSPPPAPPQAPIPPKAPAGAPDAFSLDLDLPEPQNLSAGPSMLPPIEGYGAGAPAPDADALNFGASGFGDISDSDPLARKLELADEFRQIGDVEGARDLLEEVIEGADGALKAKAEAMLASLS